MADGTIQLAGGNNITLSTATAGSITSITISGANVGGAQTGISGVSNSEVMYTSGTIKLSGLGAITVRSTTGQAFQFSVNSQTAQTGISGISNSETTYTSGTVGLSVVGGPMTIRSTTGNAFQFSVSQSVQVETQTFLGALKNTETTYTSGTVELEGTNNITVFSTTGQRFRISGANTHAVQTAISGIANSETTYTSGTVSLSALANMTIRSTTGNQFQFSVHAPETALSVGVSTGGNTAGNTTVNTGSQLVFSGQANITLSQATAAGATTIGISGGAGGGGSFSGGISNLGNTAGSTGVTGTRLVLAATNDITLSQSTDANGGTATISHGPILSGFHNAYAHGTAGAIVLLGIPGARSWQVFPLNHGQPFPGVLTANTAYFRYSLSGSTATMSSNYTTTWSVGVWTRNVSTLSLLNSASVSFGYAGVATDNSTGLVGDRYLSIHSSLWSAQPVFTQGEYWVGVAYSTGGQSFQSASQWMIGDNQTSVRRNSGTIGVATIATNATQAIYPFAPGLYTATSASPPTAIGSNELSRNLGNDALAPFIILVRDGPQSF